MKRIGGVSNLARYHASRLGVRDRALRTRGSAGRKKVAQMIRKDIGAYRKR